MIPDDVTIQVLTPAREELIRRSFESLKGAKRAIVHVYNAVAPIMRRVVFNMSQDEVLNELAVKHARLARRLADENPGTDWRFEYSPEMFSRSEEHTSELQSLMRISYAVFCLKKKKNTQTDIAMTFDAVYDIHTPAHRTQTMSHSNTS